MYLNFSDYNQPFFEENFIHECGRLIIYCFEHFSHKQLQIFLMYRYGSIFFQQSCKTRTKVFICYSEGSLVQPIDFVVHFSAMKHPNQWTILELTSNKCSHQKVSIYQYLETQTFVTKQIVYCQPFDKFC